MRDIFSVPWALFVVLGVQAVLSLRLIWANTAFFDEATYIWAGRIEIQHWLSGVPAPAYPSYFSGAPVIYPPLAALADLAGGLAAARMLSLACMLGVTCMLWGTTRSLFGQRAGLAAAAISTMIGSIQFLGALASYDALALFLLTLSVRLVVAARTRDDSTRLLIAAIVVLALGNATKYATGLFDPVVFALAALTSPRGLKSGVGRGGYLATATIGLLAVLLAAGGSLYAAGIESTTLSRTPGTSPPEVILADSARWAGFVVILAVVAAVVGWKRDRPRAPLIALLLLASVLVPVNQARIHTTVSLLKHVDFGAWFACIAAGYVVAVLTSMSRRAWLRGIAAVAVCAGLLLLAGPPGRAQAASFEDGWPNTTQLVAQLRPIVRDHPGVYLAEDPTVLGYYFEHQVRWQDWQNTSYFSYRPPGSAACRGGPDSGLSGPALAESPAAQAITQAIARQYFRLIVLNHTDTVAVDHEVEADISRYHDYRLVAEAPFSDSYGHGMYLVWAPTASGAEGQARGTDC
ncbi:MAG TPA: glycosyltransferase family 39 protein [Trebonia sp.]